jgi:hypothetical protein
MDNESLLAEFVYCITDEQRARPWNNELAERTEAARQAVLQRMSAASSSTAEEVRRLREVVEKIAKQWDGCFYENAIGGDIDIGEAIRSALKENGQ